MHAGIVLAGRAVYFIRMDERVRLIAGVVLVLVVSGLAFGAAILGVPTVYSWWMQYQCWRAGRDSEECPIS